LSSPDIDICIIGAGVIGTSITRQVNLAYPDLTIMLIEQNQNPGMVTSARNSEVLHAGLYYPPHSLKAKHCIRGHQKLMKFCEERHVPCHNSGKYIVANEGEEATLLGIERNASACGVTSLEHVTRKALKQLEPNIKADQALFSPATAIIDSHQLMLALQADIPATTIALATELIAISPYSYKGHTAFSLVFRDHNTFSEFTVSSQLLINAAGLTAPLLANELYQKCGEQMRRPDWLRGHFEYSKGNYFGYSGQSPFSSLVYPVPARDGRGLGVHATLDLAGQCRFGPDVERLQLDSEAIKGANLSAATIYEVDSARLDHFIQQISRYYPSLDPSRLQPDYSGIRCQWKSPAGYTDFQIDDQLASGVGLLQYLGIDSPGLTSSLSLAEDAVQRIRLSGLFH